MASRPASLSDSFTALLHDHWRALALGAEPPPHSCVLCHCESVQGVLAVVRAWRNAPVKPPGLHLICVSADRPDTEPGFSKRLDGLAEEVRVPAFEWPEAQSYMQQLFQNTVPALLPLRTDDPSLHLFLGARSLSQLLVDQALSLDALLWPDLQDPYGPRLCARVVRQDALLLVRQTHPLHQEAQKKQDAALRQAGFVHQSNPKAWRYQPNWSPRTRTGALATATSVAKPAPTRHAVVVGAGLAGACSAWHLATRGWQVTVLDEAEDMAQGASQLPAGLICPVLAANSPLSDLSQLGVWSTVQLCHALQAYGLREGQDFAFTGVLQKSSLNGTTGDSQRWHPLAGWIKPSRLVQSCLSHPSIYWQARTQVTAFTQGETHSPPLHLDAHPCTPGQPSAPALRWTLHVIKNGATSTIMADLLVVSNANGASKLLTESAIRSASPAAWMPCPNLAAVGGQLTYGWHEHPLLPTEWPTFPVNGGGHVMGGIPLDSPIGSNKPNWAWMVGATYHTSPQSTPIATIDQRADTLANLTKAAALLPEMANFFHHLRTIDGAQAWTGTRCVTPDRLPLVGNWPISGCVNPPLTLVGLGSRGLSLAPLTAHLLAAQLNQEPLPLPKRLVKVLSPARYI